MTRSVAWRILAVATISMVRVICFVLDGEFAPLDIALTGHALPTFLRQ